MRTITTKLFDMEPLDPMNTLANKRVKVKNCIIKDHLPLESFDHIFESNIVCNHSSSLDDLNVLVNKENTYYPVKKDFL